MTEIAKLIGNEILSDIPKGLVEQLKENNFVVLNGEKIVYLNYFYFTHVQQDNVESMEKIYVDTLEEFFQLTPHKLESFMFEHQIALSNGVTLEYEDETRNEFKNLISKCLTGQPPFINHLNPEEPEKDFGDKFVMIRIGAYFSFDKKRSKGWVTFFTNAIPLTRNNDGDYDSHGILTVE